MKVEQYIGMSKDEQIKNKTEELQKLTRGFFEAMRDGTLKVFRKPPRGYKWNSRGLLVDGSGNVIQPPVYECDDVPCKYSNQEYLGMRNTNNKAP